MYSATVVAYVGNTYQRHYQYQVTLSAFIGVRVCIPLVWATIHRGILTENWVMHHMCDSHYRVLSSCTRGTTPRYSCYRLQSNANATICTGSGLRLIHPPVIGTLPR